MNARAHEMIVSIQCCSINNLVSEVTNRSYESKALCHLFRKLHKRASIEGVHFHDIRKIADSELENRGATETEISSITGHAPESKIIKNLWATGMRGSS